MLERRQWLKSLGASAAGMAAAPLIADLPNAGDPDTGYNKYIYRIADKIKDLPSATIVDGQIVQPARTVPVFHQTDVVVVGGGPAGVAAAIEASRGGAKVAIVERYGSLGGLFTNGLVLIFVGTGVRVDGKFRLCTRGFCEEFIERLEKMGPGCITKRPAPGGVWHPTADPEAAKFLMDEMVREAKIETFFHSWGVDVIQVGSSVKGVVFESKQGRQAILAKQVIDTTGDGDVYFQAGVDFDQITHGIGFCYQIGGMDRISPTAKPDSRRFPMRSNEPNPSLYWVNAPSVTGNGLDVRELSAAEMHHRREAWKKVSAMKATQGYEAGYLSSTCSQIGVRATRLMKGLSTISKADAVRRNGAAIADAIGVSGCEGVRRPEFGIPYGTLVPVGVDNLLAAGRCISCSPDIIDRIRLFPVCFVTGQAAGAAAAMAVAKGCTPSEINVDALRKVLVSRSVYLGQG